ncbi:MAG TPA: glycosyltransferase [Pyrinomonadaceae bacterium]
MTRIAILAQTIADGDAVGNDVCGMASTVASKGHEVRIFGEGGNVAGHTIWPISEAKSFLESTSDVAIYHHSIGWNAGVALLAELQDRKTVIKYHNVTPPEFFAGISDDFEARCKLGRDQINDIAGGEYNLYLADSAFNLRELGTPVNKSFVVPPFHHADQLLSVKPHLPTLDLFNNGKANIVMVGRVSPNKGHVELIESFARYYYDYNRHSQLLIIGHREQAFESYYRNLDDLISSLCLEGAVIFTGAVTLDVLKAYYLTAHLMLVTSRHEGFCVPLVEAMAMKVPIVAYSYAAVPETVDDVAVLWNEHDPALVAESINAIVTNEETSASLIFQGAARYQQIFKNDKTEQRFLRAMSEVLKSS